MVSSTAPVIPTKAYMVGGGIASLSSAVYLIRHVKMNPKDITIFENLSVTGGSMDAAGDTKKGYLMRGGRMFDREAYTCLYDLLSEIPSTLNPGSNCKDDIYEFSAKYPTDSHARLIDEGCIIADASQLGVSLLDNTRFGELLIAPEDTIQGKGINDWFTPAFFTSHFWYCMRSTFAFQPWHSLIEFKRYCLRFMHEVPKLFNLGGVWRTPFNQYDSIIAPTTKWLKEQGINFEFGVNVTALDFAVEKDARSVYRIHLTRNRVPETIEVSKTDRVFVTLGSLTAASTIGSMDKPAPAIIQSEAEQDPTWALWKDIAKRQPDFGRPEVFSKDVNASKFLSFSVTCFDDSFFKRYVEWSTNEPGTGALVTFKHSKWGMSIVVPHQPHFAGQPENVKVFWGYGLFPDEIGNFVKKPMTECTGAEIMMEVIQMLAFESDMKEILENSTCIPSMLPYTMSQFVKRSNGDRPLVVPKDSVNFAFLGQFVEVPLDVVFTVEYSVRCAQTAVFKLCNVDREVTPIYKGWRDPAVLVSAAKAMLS
ncbi:67 kDa myosin-cross-reactive antigen family protein [Rhizoclosmatium globosum]|uniref:67 kDa myosin-cross-reactive antigen family protein n=1 Tax=Rhizoclosmatium globosum TaxID=329046 RepID=A0A1Y2CFU7_9FUNG|nr:67 kDa myosin-cross-reactive antigen family protein [Rhizoclosmatium globosum]|eukprot:ORY45943.1 67 kDa myosin-cross-reactive antigen family protein [Rhizoclosmatium globosum]